MTETKLIAALVKAQHATGTAAKDAANPFFKSKYATLEAVWSACGPALEANGLSVHQFPGYDPERQIATLSTTIAHVSGETWDCGTAAAPVEKPTAQGMGSAISYLRRYSLSAIMGVLTEDDDGNAASRPPAQPARKQAAPKEMPKTPVPMTDDQRVTLEEFADPKEGKEMSDKERLGLQKWLELKEQTSRQAEKAIERFRDRDWMDTSPEEDDEERARLIKQIQLQLEDPKVGSETHKTVSAALKLDKSTIDELREMSQQLFRQAAKGDK